MAKEIGVYVNDLGFTTSFGGNGKLIIYRKMLGKWTPLREQKLVIDKTKGLKDLRAKMVEAITFLDECKVFVAHSVIGIPYYALEKAKFSIWEYTGEPLEFLDYILQKEEETMLESKEKPNNVVPIPTLIEDGNYTISIKQIQENNSQVTSKQMLLPFLRKGEFFTLEVICNHIPMWLEMELQSLGYKFLAEKIGPMQERIYITKKTCSDC